MQNPKSKMQKGEKRRGENAKGENAISVRFVKKMCAVQH